METVCPDCKGMTKQMPCDRCESINNIDFDLKPCPFCGTQVFIRSNRDTHKLAGDHKEDCFFGEDHIMETPATDEAKQQIINFWNKRS